MATKYFQKLIMVKSSVCWATILTYLTLLVQPNNSHRYGRKEDYYLLQSEHFIAPDIKIPITEAPFIAVIYTGEHHRLQYKCTGVILSPSAVLTLAKPIKMFASTPDQIKVQAGCTEVFGPGVMVVAKQIIIHPLYKPENSTIDNNLGIILLDLEFSFSDRLRSIEGPPVNFKLEVGSNVHSILYPGLVHRKLHKIASDVIEIKDCGNKLKSPPFFCIQPNYKDEDGSAHISLIIQNDILIGIAVYVNSDTGVTTCLLLSHYDNWIQTKVEFVRPQGKRRNIDGRLEDINQKDIDKDFQPKGQPFVVSQAIPISQHPYIVSLLYGAELNRHIMIGVGSLVLSYDIVLTSARNLHYYMRENFTLETDVIHARAASEEWHNRGMMIHSRRVLIHPHFTQHHGKSDFDIGLVMLQHKFTLTENRLEAIGISPLDPDSDTFQTLVWGCRYLMMNNTDPDTVRLLKLRRISLPIYDFDNCSDLYWRHFGDIVLPNKSFHLCAGVTGAVDVDKYNFDLGAPLLSLTSKEIKGFLSYTPKGVQTQNIPILFVRITNDLRKWLLNWMILNSVKHKTKEDKPERFINDCFDADLVFHPYIVAIFANVYPYLEAIGTGVILNNRTIITSYEAIRGYENTPEKIKIQAGAIKHGVLGLITFAKKIVTDPFNRIGLIFLEFEIRLENTIERIEIASKRVKSNYILEYLLWLPDTFKACYIQVNKQCSNKNEFCINFKAPSDKELTLRGLPAIQKHQLVGIWCSESNADGKLLFLDITIVKDWIDTTMNSEMKTMTVKKASEMPKYQTRTDVKDQHVAIASNPYLVSLLYGHEINNLEMFGVGSLIIDFDIVITSGRLLAKYLKEDVPSKESNMFQVRAGSIYWHEDGVQISSKKVMVHPKWNKWEDEDRNRHDIGIIFLLYKFALIPNHIELGELATFPDKPNTTMRTLSWGITTLQNQLKCNQTALLTRKLTTVAFPLFDIQECKNIYFNNLESVTPHVDYNLCASTSVINDHVLNGYMLDLGAPLISNQYKGIQGFSVILSKRTYSGDILPATFLKITKELLIWLEIWLIQIYYELTHSE